MRTIITEWKDENGNLDYRRYEFVVTPKEIAKALLPAIAGDNRLDWTIKINDKWHEEVIFGYDEYPKE